MKKVLRVGLISIVVMLVTFVVGKFFFPLVASKFVKVEVSYAEYPVETMIMEADLIFLGQIIEVGETRWNQENGEYWDEGLPYHNVTLAVIQPLVGDLTDEISLTVIGNSPLDSSQEAILQSNNSLEKGDEIIVFARETEFTWREPERIPAIMFMGGPETSILTKEEDGLYYSINGDVYSLNELTDAVKQK